MKEISRSNMKIYVLGGAIGLLTGLTAAFLLIRQQDESGESLKLTSGDGAKIGMGLIALLRTITDFGKKS